MSVESSTKFLTESANAKTNALFGVRRVLDRVVIGRKTFYSLDWEPTLEPKENVPGKLIALFEQQRRALVRRAFIEDEAVEDNSLNTVEG